MDKAARDIQKLALPHPTEQLILTPDATVRKPAGGWILFVQRDDKYLPVSFYSFKLQDHVQKWWPCETEALTAATSVEKAASYILESKLRTLVLVDNKPVIQAANLIKEGKFSASPRMQTFLTCINRFPSVFQHLSGKMSQNLYGADFQKNRTIFT